MTPPSFETLELVFDGKFATWNAGMLSEADLQAGLTAQLEKSQAHYDD